MTDTTHNDIESFRKSLKRSISFNERKLQSTRMIAWCKHPKTELFTSTSLSSLMSITELKQLHGYQPIDEPLSAGVLPDGRYYRYLLKPVDVLDKEKSELDSKIEREYRKDLETRTIEEISLFIEKVVDVQRSSKGEDNA